MTFEWGVQSLLHLQKEVSQNVSVKLKLSYEVLMKNLSK